MDHIIIREHRNDAHVVRYNNNGTTTWNTVPREQARALAVRLTAYSIAFNLDYFENAEQEDRYHAIKAR
jgi:hypothetical protein